jgi:hypothetical protein
MTASSVAVPDLEHSPLLGELARPVFHECNNFLNDLLMHIALLEGALPESARADFAILKNQAKQLAGLIADWQNYRKPNVPGPCELDLPSLCDEVLHEITREFDIAAASITVAGPRPCAVRSTPGPLKRLCYFLLADSVLSTTNREMPGAIEIRWRDSEGVILQIDDNRPAVSENVLHNWFMPGERIRPRRLQLAACGALAYRCNAKLRAEHSPLGGVSMVISFSESAL